MDFFPSLAVFRQRHRISDCAWCLDIDGTLVRFEEPIEGASAFLKFLIVNNIPYVIVSNTGQKDSTDVSSSLKRLLNVDVPTSRIFTACDEMKMHIRKSHESYSGKILVHAPAGMNSKVIYADLLNLNNVIPMVDGQGKYYEENDISCICIFFDGFLQDFHQCISYVANHAANGVMLFVTSKDSTLVKSRSGSKWMQPGPGVFVSCIQEMVPSAKIESFGKEKWALQMDRIMESLKEQRFEGPKERIIVIGDKYDTDMALGLKQGTKTILVESGCDSEKDGHALQRRIDMVAGSIKDIPLELSYSMRDVHISNQVIKFLKARMMFCLNTVSTHLSSSTKNILGVINMVNEKMTSSPRRIKSFPTRLDELL